MKIAKNKTLAIAITILLAFLMMLIPNASAHTPPWKIPTYAYVQCDLNPVGVNQTTRIDMWLDVTFDSADLINNYRFQNYVITITAPDGTITKQTFDTVADPTSNQGYMFTPTQAGTYILNFTFPGQTITTSNGNPTSAYINDTYLASSASTTLTVQEAPLPTPYAGAPLPTRYWTRPIYGENTLWYTISSNWLGPAGFGLAVVGYGSDFPGDAVGPQTSHIMWTKPIQSGGVVGGNNFQIKGDTYEQGSAYLDRFQDPIIMDGMLYYTEPIGFAATPYPIAPDIYPAHTYPYGPTDCVDLTTGKLIWSSTEIPAPSFGIIYDVQDPNQHGVMQPILIAIDPSTGAWDAFDGYTGDSMFNVTNVPSGPTAIGSNGEYLIYVLTNAGTPTNPQYYLGQWNSSNLWTGQLNHINGANPENYFPTTLPPITDGSNPAMYDWNVSIPSLNTATTTPTALAAFSNNMLICENGSFPAGFAQPSLYSFTPTENPYTYFAINLNPSKGAIGSILWRQTVQPPTGNLTVWFIGADPTADAGTGVFFEYHLETMQWVGYSMATGKEIWGPVGNESSLSYYNNDQITDGRMAQCAYGNLYTTGYGGIVYCYNLTNGDLLWTYGNGGADNSTNSNLLYPGVYPTFMSAIGNGILYLVTAHHTFETPLYKGALMRAINATTGKEIWTLSSIQSEISQVGIADGYAAFFNGYDNSVYCVGRGPSATTVSVPHAGLSFGQPVVISGTVMDISAGTKQTEQAADFPNGVPCASDASMTAWMGYVYQQQPEPTDFAGVPVTISVTDSNNNHYVIGTATTDASGFYHLTWTPIIPSNFTVYATFAGTNAYWPSSAEDEFTVMQAPTTAPTASPPTGLASTGSLELGIAAVIIIMVICVAVLAVLILRKRP